METYYIKSINNQFVFITPTSKVELESTNLTDIIEELETLLDNDYTIKMINNNLLEIVRQYGNEKVGNIIVK